jgi:cyclopropane-fatty-acyl-phospholipid synthase
MIEAVGERYWPTYFTAIDRLLKPGGRVGLQSITMPHDRMLASRGDYSWMHKYVFPAGSSRPSGDRAAPAAHTTLRLAEQRSLGPHYARTLAHWRENFLPLGAVAALGFDSTFRRMWEFYLAYCEAGFRVGYLDVFQFSLARR